MSELKFACPVCGQHITADSKSSGTQLECPTCFKKIIVPQAPASGESKFVLSAAAADRPRSPGLETTAAAGSRSAPERPFSLVASLLTLALLCAAGVTLYLFREKLVRAFQPPAQSVTSGRPKAPPRPAHVPVVYPVPTNAVWTLTPTNLVIPAETAAGRLHGSGFFCERAVLQGGTLVLRQGPPGPPDLGVGIQFFARTGEELGGKTIEITPDRAPPLPKVTLRWRDQQQKPANKVIPSGYALKIVFGQPADNRMPGKLYLALPDDDNSFMAGTFNAEIRQPPPPKPNRVQSPSQP